MPTTYECPACPEDCSDISVPDYVQNDCDQGYLLEPSEICGIYLSAITQNATTGEDEPVAFPTDWTNAADWAAVVGTTGDTVRYITGFGDKPAANTTEAALPKNKSKVLSVQHVINFDTTDMSGDKYEFWRQLQCGFTGYMWYETQGNYLYGGPTGFQVSIKRPQYVLNRGAESNATWIIEITWNSPCDPPRIANPMA